jgi:hypothetical protein
MSLCSRLLPTGNSDVMKRCSGLWTIVFVLTASAVTVGCRTKRPEQAPARSDSAVLRTASSGFGRASGFPGTRVVRLPTHSDSRACPERVGGTVVSDELSDADIHAIAALVQQSDSSPIFLIVRPERPPPVTGRPLPVPGATEFEATTGCGPVLGRGRVFVVEKSATGWTIKSVGFRDG